MTAWRPHSVTASTKVEPSESLPDLFVAGDVVRAVQTLEADITYERSGYLSFSEGEYIRILFIGENPDERDWLYGIKLSDTYAHLRPKRSRKMIRTPRRQAVRIIASLVNRTTGQTLMTNIGNCFTPCSYIQIRHYVLFMRKLCQEVYYETIHWFIHNLTDSQLSGGAWGI